MDAPWWAVLASGLITPLIAAAGQAWFKRARRASSIEQSGAVTAKAIELMDSMEAHYKTREDHWKERAEMCEKRCAELETMARGMGL